MSDQPRWPAGVPVAPGGKGPGGGRYRPTTGYAGGWVQQLSDRIAPPGRMSHEQLAEYVERDDFEVIGGAQGGTASVAFRRYSDGRVLVHKQFGPTPTTAVAEVEASLIGHAIGAPVPAALRDPADEGAVFMEYVEADPQYSHEQYRGGAGAAERMRLHSWTSDTAPYTEDGRILGLLDTLIGNYDRHGLNLIRTPGGGIVGIDHGEAFWSEHFRHDWPEWLQPRADSLAGAGRLGRKLFQWDQSADGVRLQHFSREDIQVVRGRLQPLRPLLRPDIYRGVMLALDTLESIAVGTGRHID